jgi:prepilin-type N-terminal cleavage/methylation domain-containing protein
MNYILKTNKGFTLIEAVISLGVLSIGILALFAMQTLSIRGNANANRVTTLATWGGDEIENKLLTATDDEIEKITGAELDLSGDKNYTITKTCMLNKPVQNITTIDVKVTNKQDGKNVILRYLKAKESL